MSCGIRGLGIRGLGHFHFGVVNIEPGPFNFQVNIEIMRAFVRLRQMLASNAELSRKLASLEKKYDIQFKAVFDAIRELMAPMEPRKKRPIGFAPWKEK